jgi:hypothetical protein
LVFYERDRLGKDEFDMSLVLLQSVETKRNHSPAAAFIKANIETPVCMSCNVPKDGKRTVDGKLRVTVGKSGAEQILDLAFEEAVGKTGHQR